MQYYLDAFRQYFDFSGRATRTAFWMFALINFLVFVVLIGVEAAVGVPFISAVYSLAILIPSLSYGARRLHDMGRSGWWQLLYLLPFIGPIVILIFQVMPSDGDNKFGPASGSVDAATDKVADEAA